MHRIILRTSANTEEKREVCKGNVIVTGNVNILPIRILEKEGVNLVMVKIQNTVVSTDKVSQGSHGRDQQ